jgi:hypothetical protein
MIESPEKDDCMPGDTDPEPHLRTANKDAIPAIRALAAIAADQSEWPGVRESASKAALNIVDPGAITNMSFFRFLIEMQSGGSPVAIPMTLYLQRYWNDLAVGNTTTAYQAQWKLILFGNASTSFLKHHLKPVFCISAQRIASLVISLDARDFREREKANLELRSLMEQAEDMLRQALARTPSPEVRGRIKILLDEYDRCKSPKILRDRRSVAALEQIGGAQSVAALHELAKGAADATLTREAKAALRRLTGKGTGIR